jgi:hypothetical protein
VGLVPALVVARLRATLPRWLPTIIAVALGVSAPIVARGAGAASADAALRRGLSDLPAAERMVTVATYREPGEVLPDGLDAQARRGLAALGIDDPIHVMSFRTLADTSGGTFQLAAADELDRWVRLIDGRMPEACTPQRCEVVQLAERPPVGPTDPSLGLVVVGTVDRTSSLLLGGTFEADGEAAVLLADGVGRLDQLRALEVFGRSQGWLADVDIVHLRKVGAAGWAATARAAADDLIAAPWNLGLTAPDNVLAAEVGRARRSTDGVLLLGGSLGVLLLGAAAVAGTSMRRNHRAFVGMLRRRGADRRRILSVSAGEAGVVNVAGGLLGTALGTAVAWLLGARAGLGGYPTARTSLSQSLPTLAVYLAASVALMLIALLADGGSPGRRGAWRSVEVAAAVAVGCVIVLAASPSPAVDGQRGATALIPALALVACGLVTARVWPWVVRGLGRLLSRQSVSAQLGVTGAAARPLRPVASAALLATAIAATVFGISYRQTLQRGADDQAAFAVPLDVRVRTGPGLERALDLVQPGGDDLPEGSTAWPVLRVTASIPATSGRGTTVQMIGVDSPMLPRVQRWSATVRSSSGAATAQAIDVPQQPVGVSIPAGDTLVIDATGPAVQLGVTATVRTSDGRVRSVPLRVDPQGGRDGQQTLSGDLPDVGGDDTVELVALTASESMDAATRRQHNLGEGNKDRESPSATIMLGELTIDGTPVASPWISWSGLVAEGDRHEWDFVLAGSRSSIAAQPTGPGATGDPLPVAVDSSTAAAAGGVGAELTLTVNRSPVRCRIVDVLPSFPTVSGRFAIVDRSALQRLVDVIEPGTGQPGELWIDLGGSDSRLDSAVFERLTTTDRSALATRLRTDPVTRSALALLLGVSALTMVLALAMLISFAISERHDERAVSLSWEAEGVTPARLRRSLLWRSVATVVPAVPVGVVCGVLLSELTARLLAVTASGAVPTPPLVAGSGAWWGVASAVLCVVAALAVLAVVAARAWRERLPVLAAGEPE